MLYLTFKLHWLTSSLHPTCTSVLPCLINCVTDNNGPVCQSNIPAEGVIGPNDCGFGPTTIELACGVEFHGHSAPQLEWSLKRRDDETKFSQNTFYCNSTMDQVTCNLTVKAELKMNQSSIVCKTTGSIPHQCAIEIPKVLCKQTYLCVFYSKIIIKSFSHNRNVCS